MPENDDNTLSNHLNTLENSKNKYLYVLENDEERKKLKTRLASHLRKAGYTKGTRTKAYANLLYEYIDFIFETQDCKPFYYFKVKDFFSCWNRPRFWGEIDYIKYEWGHLYPSGVDENKKPVDILENLSLQSGRCNDHIQSGLSVDRVKLYGGKLEERINQVKAKRQKLFQSDEWKQLKKEFSKYKE
ncbi:MAG: hypothetical protein MJ174_00325 [Treponema sp.]|nr:hypothetical protein [Treponema sp.]